MIFEFFHLPLGLQFVNLGHNRIMDINAIYKRDYYDTLGDAIIIIFPNKVGLCCDEYKMNQIFGVTCHLAQTDQNA